MIFRVMFCEMILLGGRTPQWPNGGVLMEATDLRVKTDACL